MYTILFSVFDILHMYNIKSSRIIIKKSHTDTHFRI